MFILKQIKWRLKIQIYRVKTTGLRYILFGNQLLDRVVQEMIPISSI